MSAKPLWATGPFRSPSRGRISGICQGLGEHYQVNPKYVRLAFILGAVFSGFFPMILVYIVLTIFLPIGTDSLAERYYRAGIGSGNGPFGEDIQQRVKERFQSLDQRLARMEGWVTSDDYRLRQKFRDL